MSPERSLWCAVLVKTIHDFEIRLRQIRRLKKSKSRYGMQRALIDHNQLWHEISSKWFNNICEMANIRKSDFHRHIRKMHIKYGLGELIQGIKGLQ